jgi:hypothetical protein
METFYVDMRGSLKQKNESSNHTGGLARTDISTNICNNVINDKNKEGYKTNNKFFLNFTLMQKAKSKSAYGSVWTPKKS